MRIITSKKRGHLSVNHFASYFENSWIKFRRDINNV